MDSTATITNSTGATVAATSPGRDISSQRASQSGSPLLSAHASVAPPDMQQGQDDDRTATSPVPAGQPVGADSSFEGRVTRHQSDEDDNAIAGEHARGMCDE